MTRNGITVLAVVALAWAVYVLRADSSPVPVGAPVAAPAAQPQFAVARPSPLVERSPVPEGAINTGLQFDVFASNGVGLGDVKVQAFTIIGRSVTMGRMLGKTADGGRLTLSSGALPGDSSGVLMSRSGFATAAVIAPHDGGCYRVTLERQAVVRVHVTDIRGNPVEGVRMSMSACAASAAFDTRDVAPDLPAGVAVSELSHLVWEAATGPDGIATCDALPSGTYAGDLRGPWVEIRRDGDWVVDLAPGQSHEVRVTVARPAAVAIRFVGDELVSHQWTPGSREMSFDGVGLSQIRVAAKRSYPNHLIAVVSSTAQVGQKVQMRLVADFATKGTTEFLVDLLPVAQLDETLIDVSSYPSIVNRACVTFKLTDARGDELTMLDLYARSEAGRSYSVKSSVACWLPPGQYRLWTLQPAVSDLFDSLPPVTVAEEDLTVECRVDVAVSVFKVWPIGVGGGMPNRASAILTNASGDVLSERFLEFSGREPLTVWVPATEVAAKLTLRSFGYHPYELHELHREELRSGVNYIQLEPLH